MEWHNVIKRVSGESSECQKMFKGLLAVRRDVAVAVGVVGGVQGANKRVHHVNVASERDTLLSVVDVYLVHAQQPQLYTRN
jgi:hypothetical protein